MTLTATERSTIKAWRPSRDNPICECSGNNVCAPCALLPIIDRLVEQLEIMAERLIMCERIVNLAAEELFEHE